MVPEQMSSEGEDRLNLVFGALADPTRRAILARLSAGEASVGELAEPFSIGLRAVSKHVGVLERAGLVARSRDAQRRLSRIEARALHDAFAWLESYRILWEGRFDRIERLIEGAKGGKR